MFVRSVSFVLAAETPAAHDSGIFLAEPGPPAYEDDRPIFTVHGSVRAPAVDIEVERIELVRGVFLTLIFAPSQAPLTTSLAGARLVFPDDIADIGDDLVASFRCEIALPPAPMTFYLHAAFRQYVSSVVRLRAPRGAR